jgi:hypothetical protein
MPEMPETLKLKMIFDGTDCFIELEDGTRIARRENEAWTSLQPGWQVTDNLDQCRDNDEDMQLNIYYNGVRVH